MTPYFSEMDMFTGKSSMNSGGKNSSAWRFWNGVWPAWAPSSMTWSLDATLPSGITVFCAKAITWDLAALPVTWCVLNAQACASSSWDLPSSLEYSCILPLTRPGREGSPAAMPTTLNHLPSWLAR